MPSPDTLQAAAERLRIALAAAATGLVEREAFVETIGLAAVAGEHVLVIGPPGTAKSEAVRRVAQAIDGRYFEYLLGRFTEPSEIFGPIDLRKLREGVVETDITGMLPEAEIAFLDEVFLGSTAILNTLLGILNERLYRRGHTEVRVPLRLCVGASNALPTDDALNAFADRFLVRVYLTPVPDPRLEELLEGGRQARQAHKLKAASIGDIDLLASAARDLDLVRVRPLLAHALRRLRHAGVTLSDRRAVKVQSLIAAAAVLDGRTMANESDLWPLLLAIPTQDGQATARAALHELLTTTQNKALYVVAEETSLGALARARRIMAEGERLLSQTPGAHSASDWRLRLEGVAREIDASFAPNQMPDELRAFRQRIVETLSPQSDLP